MLVSRIVEVLRSGRAVAEELAVITFTEAAAAEIAARVRQELETALASAGDAGERERLHDALAGLHRARLETIHAFATNLLRERPIEAGLDPQFEVMDALAAELALDAAYDAWLTRVLAEPQPQLSRAIGRGFDLVQIRRLVEAIHARRSLLPLAAETPPAVDLDAFALEVGAIAQELRDLADRAASDETACSDIAAALAFAERLAAARGDVLLVERAVLFDPPRLKPTGGRQADWDDPADCRRCKELRTRLRDAVRTLQAALRSEAIVDVLPLAEAFVADYEAERRARGTADFDDLLHWTRDLLATSPEARAYARARFTAILVDEFQDTDAVQAEIAVCLASDDIPGDDWLAMRPRPGALTVVGDPKQSIYRFRRADIAVYDAVRHGALAGGEEQLEQNFRSTAGVLAFSNELFDRVLVEQEGVQPGNTRLQPADARLTDESRSLCVVRGSVETGADRIRAEEARVLAGTLRLVVGEGWPVRDPESGAERAARWGDIAILVPRRTALDIYLDAFRRAGVPVRAESGRSFFQRQEVRDLANVLRAIDDPLDAVSLVAALRSSAFGCSDEDVFLHAAGGARLDLRAPPGDDGPASVRESLTLLRDLHDLRSRVSLAQLVRAVLERTRLVEIALLGFDGQQSAANLVKLADQARAFSSSGGGGLRAFARWLSEQRASSDVTEATVAEEADDVARLLTVHAAKGLEFPVVALANLATAPRNDVEPVADRHARRLHLRIKAGDAEFATPGFDAAWQVEQGQRSAEQQRLLYVAVTRARDHLIVPVTSAPRAGSMLFDLEPSLVEGPARVEIDGSALPQLPDDEQAADQRATPAAVDAALAERETWESRRQRTVARAREELEVIPATRDEGDEPVTAPLLGADDAPLIAGEGPPLPKGEALHKVLELVDLADPSDLAEITRGVCLVAGVEEAAEVLAMALACLSSEPLQRALRADGLLREVPYTRRVPTGYATGRMDVVFREGDRLVVIDWKSDSVGPGAVTAAAATHRHQADEYRAALRAATGLDANEVLFVFARAGGAAAAA